jgi:hypothetical protein
MLVDESSKNTKKTYTYTRTMVLAVVWVRSCLFPFVCCAMLDMSRGYGGPGGAGRIKPRKKG